jgi:hypothetical protein
MLALRLLSLIALAAALGAAGLFLTDKIIGPTHNVAAVMIDLIVGGAVALVSLGIAMYLIFRR